MRKTQVLGLDMATAAGLVLAFGGIFATFLVQGGNLRDLLQLSSAILLLAGTCGAVLVTMPFSIVRSAVGQLPALFAPEEKDQTSETLALIARLSKKAKRTGLVSLETDLDSIEKPFLRRAVQLAADGMAAEEVSAILRQEIRITGNRMERQARVFETAGGYAPTFGILGAVLGLIQVMKHLDEMSAVGHGIAQAFVSTVYGLALANLLLFPIGGRLRAAAARWREEQEFLADGVASLMQLVHPLMMEAKLRPHLVNAGSESSAA